jgi:hypothetical protein
MAVKSKLEKLIFSGKEEDFSYFAELFEARIYVLKLSKVLLDKIKVTAEKDDETNDQRVDREAEEAALAELRYSLWCELVQCLDRKSVLLVRAHKGNGCAAWKALVHNFKSSERPRIQGLMTKLMSLRMEANETMVDYLVRAEELQMDLEDANQGVTGAMFSAMILKGLSKDYDPMVTLINYGAEKTYEQMKQDLLNFANDKTPAGSSAFHSGKPNNIRCYNCKKTGHRRSDCKEKPTPGAGHSFLYFRLPFLCDSRTPFLY